MTATSKSTFNPASEAHMLTKSASKHHHSAQLSTNLEDETESPTDIVDIVRHPPQLPLMPEDDRFSKCMAKGYRSGYIHARKGHSEASVARRIGAGIARQMKDGAFRLDALKPVLESLERALSDTQSRRGELFHPTDEIRLELHRCLERVAIKHASGASTRMLCETTRQVFEHLQSSNTVTPEQARAVFAQALTKTLTDHWCFSVNVGGVTARQEIMRRNQRDAEAQRDFERQVNEKLVPVVADLMRQALRAADGKPRRTPPLPKPLPRFEMDEIHASLAQAETL